MTPLEMAQALTTTPQFAGWTAAGNASYPDWRNSTPAATLSSPDGRLVIGLSPPDEFAKPQRTGWWLRGLRPPYLPYRKDEPPCRREAFALRADGPPANRWMTHEGDVVQPRHSPATIAKRIAEVGLPAYQAQVEADEFDLERDRAAVAAFDVQWAAMRAILGPPPEFCGPGYNASGYEHHVCSLGADLRVNVGCRDNAVRTIELRHATLEQQVWISRVLVGCGLVIPEREGEETAAAKRWFAEHWTGEPCPSGHITSACGKDSRCRVCGGDLKHLVAETQPGYGVWTKCARCNRSELSMAHYQTEKRAQEAVERCWPSEAAEARQPTTAPPGPRS